MQNFNPRNLRLVTDSEGYINKSSEYNQKENLKTSVKDYSFFNYGKNEVNILIDKIRKNLIHRNTVIEQIYNDPEINRVVKGTLIKMGCANEYCEDYFTEALVNFIKACYKPNFEIKANLTNYLTAIAKNLWLKEVTRNNRLNTIDKEILSNESSIESYEVVIIADEKKRLLEELLNYLDKTCYRVLTLWSLKKCMKDIAVEMNYKSEGMARKKKHQCLRKLYKILEEHPTLKQQLR